MEGRCLISGPIDFEEILNEAAASGDQEAQALIDAGVLKI